MENWTAVFVTVAAIALVLQMLVMVGMYIEVKRANERITRILADLELRMTPVLTRVNQLMDQSQGRLTSVLEDSAEIIHIARGQAQKFDRVFSEAVDRLRLQIIRADGMLTGALEAVEDAGSRIRKSVWGPMQEASALIHGVKTGLEYFRSRRRPPNRSREHPDEGLFI